VNGAIAEAARALLAGLVVGLPTDTVYGLAAAPRQPEAMARLFLIKGRSETKPIGLLVSDTEAALEMVDLPDYAIGWAVSHWPGPLNLVGRARFDLPEGLGNHERGTVAIRVPDFAITREILATSGAAAVTSANRTGEPDTFDEVEARSFLGDAVDLYVPGRSPGLLASTTVDVTGPKPVLLRKGPLDLGL
jgi:tRNA threonylcarbamoyl adenosine modification protein (Sua5/YciO/YrdC/YwlC family)